MHKNNCKDSSNESSIKELASKAQNHERQGNYTAAEKLYKKVIAKSKSKSGENDDAFTLRIMQNLAIVQRSAGKYSEAADLNRECLDKMKIVLGENHPDTLDSMQGLAVTLSRQEKFSEAEKLNKECLDRSIAVLGENHYHTLATMMSLAISLTQQGKHSAAEALCKQCLDKRKKVLGENHRDTLNTMQNLAVYIVTSENLN